MDPEKIKKSLKSGHFFNSLHLLDETESTNDLLVSWAKEGTSGPGTLVHAELQTSGKGRMGRKWESIPYSALTFSFLSPNFFPRSPGKITIGIALSIARAVEIETGLSPQIKWPNDLYLEGKKLGGILAQTAQSPTGSLLAVGIGLNINATPPGEGRKTRAAPICLKEATGKEISRTPLLISILDEIDLTFSRFADGKSHFVVEGLRARSLLLGAHAVFEWKKRKYQGTVRDHTRELGILLETEAGIVVLPGETAHLVSFQRA